MNGKRITQAAVAAILAAGVLCAGIYWLRTHSPFDIRLGSIQARGQKILFGVKYTGWDSAELGFAAKDGSGHTRYFPTYASTYRGIEPVTLDVYLSDTEEEMWVYTSWTHYKKLAYYHLGSGRWITHCGENPSLDTTKYPAVFGGRPADFPPMDATKVKKAATIVYRK